MNVNDIKITLNEVRGSIPEGARLGFGNYYADQMFIMDYDAEKGWHDARIVPFGPLSLHPATTVFHYGAECFEGMKAYRTPDGSVQLFRPQENFKRLNSSAERIGLAEVPEDFALEALKKLVALCEQYVPNEPGTSLYIRPFLYGADETLGVHSINRNTFIIIMCPVGSYFGKTLEPVKIMIENDDVRAVRGGTGYTKCGGNYAASNRAGLRAEKLGYSQVLWLDGVERKYIEEVGAMNVMFKIAGKVVTPMLTGSILPGITRKSCLELLRDNGYEAEERLLSVDELRDAIVNGTLEEAWGCGTAAVISPIGTLAIDGKPYVINNNEVGPVSRWLYDTLTGIQWGKGEDKYGWTVKVC